MSEQLTDQANSLVTLSMENAYQLLEAAKANVKEHGLSGLEGPFLDLLSLHVDAQQWSSHGRRPLSLPETIHSSVVSLVEYTPPVIESIKPVDETSKAANSYYEFGIVKGFFKSLRLRPVLSNRPFGTY